jgi:protein-disulfide isomerase
MNDSEHSEHGHKSHHESRQKESTKSNPHKWLIWASVIQILLLIYIVFQMGGQGGLAVNNQAAPTPAAVPSAAPSPNIDMEALMDDDAVKGDPNAPVTIIEFSDFECPFCARFYSDTLSQIDEQYIKTGKVKLVYRDFPLSFHPQAQKAAEAAECAGEQGKFYDMHDLLFEQGVQGGVAGFKGYAQQIGLDTGKFNTCLDSGEMASEVRKDFSDGQKAGVQGTPGFIINGNLVSGAQPFQVFQQVIEAELS